LTSSSTTTRSTFTPADAGLLLTLAAMWGFSFLFIKVAVDEVSPLWVVGVRTTVGAAVLLLVLRLRGRRLPRDLAIWGHLVVLATIGNAIPWTLIAWAEIHIPSGIAAVLNAIVPAATLAVAASIGLERLSRLKIAGLGAATLGTLVVVSGEALTLGRVLPVLAAVAATFMYAYASVHAKRHVSGREGPLAIATGQVLLAAVISVPVAWLVGPTPAWAELSLAAGGSLLALGALGTGAAFLVFYTLIERVGATNATMVTYLIPVVGLAAGWLFLGEHFGPHVFVGAAVIVCGIWLAQRERREELGDDLAEMEQIRG
jgi:drug/metabolite transporter (DMT)-like permease